MITDEGSTLSELSPSMLKGSGALPDIAGVFPAVLIPTIAAPEVLV